MNAQPEILSVSKLLEEADFKIDSEGWGELAINPDLDQEGGWQKDASVHEALRLVLSGYLLPEIRCCHLEDERGRREAIIPIHSDGMRKARVKEAMPCTNKNGRLGKPTRPL